VVIPRIQHQDRLLHPRREVDLIGLRERALKVESSGNEDAALQPRLDGCPALQPARAG